MTQTTQTALALRSPVSYLGARQPEALAPSEDGTFRISGASSSSPLRYGDFKTGLPVGSVSMLSDGQRGFFRAQTSSAQEVLSLCADLASSFEGGEPATAAQALVQRAVMTGQVKPQLTLVVFNYAQRQVFEVVQLMDEPFGPLMVLRSTSDGLSVMEMGLERTRQKLQGVLGRRPTDRECLTRLARYAMGDPFRTDPDLFVPLFLGTERLGALLSDCSGRQDLEII